MQTSWEKKSSPDEKKNTQLKTFNDLNVSQFVRVMAMPVQVSHHIPVHTVGKTIIT